MSMPYPEGETFFVRSGLATSQADGYHAENPEHFHSHIMIEYIWNLPADHGSRNANSPKGYGHNRSGYRIVKGSNWGTEYGNWMNLPFSYGGPAPHQTVRRRQHNLCLSGNRFKDQEKGGSAESWFMTMPMPTKEERWVWIDMLACIRAIYIPVAYTADRDYQHMSTWLTVNFAVDGTKSIWRGIDGAGFLNHTCSRLTGLGVIRDHTIGFDISGLIEFLCIPRGMRVGNVYSHKLIRMVPAKYVITKPLVGSYHDSYDFNWTKIVNANLGLNVMWRAPVSGSWISNYFKNTFTIAVGMIPGIGPVLAIAFPLAWTAITKPEEFEQTMRNLIPGIDLGMGIIEEIKKGARDTRKYIDSSVIGSNTVPKTIQEEKEPTKGSQELGPSALFLESQKVLEESGKPAEYKKEIDGDSEVISSNPETSEEEKIADE